MTDALIPAMLDCRKAFVRQAVIRGRVPIASLGRFNSLLMDESGDITADMRFIADAEYRKVISGAVSATVIVRCQRCLEALEVDITESLNLAVVESEGLAQRLPTGLDAWITEEPMLPLHDILEEQLILGMPIVTRHTFGKCVPVGAGHVEDPLSEEREEPEVPVKNNPFSALKVLKTQGGGSSGSDT